MAQEHKILLLLHSISHLIAGVNPSVPGSDIGELYTVGVAR